jgi:hypothetical protein
VIVDGGEHQIGLDGQSGEGVGIRQIQADRLGTGNGPGFRPCGFQGTAGNQDAEIRVTVGEDLSDLPADDAIAADDQYKRRHGRKL